MSRLVVKVGGRVAVDSASQVLELAAAGHDVCVVHGAGPQISLELERGGIPVEFNGGRRVTSAAVLDVVRRSFATVNAALCAAIGERAVPLLGYEIGLQAVRWGPELGLVGDPQADQLEAVDDAIDSGGIPVVAPLALDAGDLSVILNVNADDAAAAIARGMQADTIHFLTDVEGFMIGGEVVDALDIPTAEELMRSGTLDPTILPKLQAATAAARSGVTAYIGRTEVKADETEAVPLRYLGRL